jgi:spore coat protein CotF
MVEKNIRNGRGHVHATTNPKRKNSYYKIRSLMKKCAFKSIKRMQQATDPRLKQRFQSYAQQEQQHLNTINSILSGQVPSQPQSSTASSTANQANAMLCNDMLMTEKYVSGAYNTAIFEFTDSGVRQTLNHIQKEEQQHGEGISNYMNSQGMYNVK